MQMFRAKCVACATVFDVIATPVTVDVFVRVAKGASCPMCGNRTGNTCAPSRDLTEAERAQRTGATTHQTVTASSDKELTPMTTTSLPRPVCGLGIAEYMAHASVWSNLTFGPGPRTKGVVAHIRSEIEEIENDNTEMSEWADLVILALDGCWRAIIDWNDPNDTPESNQWYPVEDDILDLLICQREERNEHNWPDFEAIHELLAEIEGPATWDEEGLTRQRRPISFLFELIALEALLQARGLGAQYSEIREAIWSKLERNMGRTWPDWRTMSPDHPIEHVRDVNSRVSP